MALSLAEYADSLEERQLIWPKVPAPEAVKAKASTAFLTGIKAVLWDVYGTLLRTPDGAFTLFPEPELRLQIALEKTIQEFNMWNFMYRKPGPPWQSLIQQYRDYAERLSMVPTKLKGDFTAINMVDLWSAVVDRLNDKDYKYDQSIYGTQAGLSEKIAFFFHSCLQATEARPGALRTLTTLADSGFRQGVLADGQPYTLLQTTRALAQQGSLPAMTPLFHPQANLLSYQMNIRKPSKSLFDQAVLQLRSLGIEPPEILHVSCRLKTDLVPAKAAGMKTALLACEKRGLEVSADLIKDPQTRPDRLLTDIAQVTEITGFG